MKSYYLHKGSYLTNEKGKYFYTLKTDLIKSGLEPHQFIKLDESDTITYK